MSSPSGSIDRGSRSVRFSFAEEGDASQSPQTPHQDPRTTRHEDLPAPAPISRQPFPPRNSPSTHGSRRSSYSTASPSQRIPQNPRGAGSRMSYPAFEPSSLEPPRRGSDPMMSEGILALRDLHARTQNTQKRHSMSFDQGHSWPVQEAPRLASPNGDRLTRSPEEYAVVEEVLNTMPDRGGSPDEDFKMERAPTLGPMNEQLDGYASRNPFVHVIQPPERSYGSGIRPPDDTYEKDHDLPFDNRALSIRKKQMLEPPLPPMIYRRSIADPANPTPAPGLRSALRHSQSEFDIRQSSNLDRGRSALLEEGPGGNTRANPGVFANLLKLYGMAGPRQRSHSHMTGSEGYSRSRCNSLDSSFFPTARDYRDRSRCSSMMSEGNMDLFDPDDPRVTGAKVNTIDQEKHAKETVEQDSAMDKKKKRQAAVKYHISSVLSRQTFILRLAKALMLFGSPSHRLESQLKATAVVLDVDAEFVHMPNIVIASFGDIDTKTSQTHFIKVNGNLQLGRLHSIHNIYRQVVHDELGVEQATMQLNKMMKSPPLFGTLGKTVLAALCTALICPLAFGGSFVDMLVAAGEGALLSYLQFGVASRNAMYSNVFEISVAIIMSFIARGLSSIPSQIFCYSAISSAGVVLVLPGYMILCSALELASKNIVGGSVKLTFAIVYSLFLGFGLTIGSDLYLLLDSRARDAQAAGIAGLNNVIINGQFRASNASAIQNFAGTFTFSNSTAPLTAPDEIVGCHRDPNWPWYLQPFPLWSLFILVPAFSIFSSAANGQPFRSKQLPVMVLISCAAFTANTAANHYIFNRSDVVSAIGAFVAGILGNLYSRITSTGTSFTSMVTGVLFLVPAGIAATGGLAMNYTSEDGDEYSNGLIIGLRTVQVAIGITVGLFASSLLIYSFGRSKRGAIFAF